MTMTLKMELKTTLKEIFEELASHGYICYFCDTDGASDGVYGYIITPFDNVLHITHEYFGGWSISFEYVPSRENGCACHCIPEDADYEKYRLGVVEVTAETVRQAEQIGLCKAFRFGAHRYKSSVEWRRRRIGEKDNLKLIGPAGLVAD